MTQVKGKVRICQSKINDFNIELISGTPFYQRYEEIRRVFIKHLPQTDIDSLLAQPLENVSKGTIDWYIPQPQEEPDSLDYLRQNNPDEYPQYAELKEKALNLIKGISNVGVQESQFVDCVLKYLDSPYLDKIVYCYDGKVTFGVWGMGMRAGRALETVITDDVRDHRVHTVRYIVQGNGKIVGKDHFLRKHGHVLQGQNDIPNIIPDNHYAFVEWQPEAPQGKPVNGDLTYYAICKRSDDYCVSFKLGEGGHYEGNDVVYKKEGQIIGQEDVPVPMAEAGFHFKRWEPNAPTGTVVNDDLEFTALFEKDKVVVPPIPVGCNIHFDAGEGGVLNGADTLLKNEGDILGKEEIPTIKAKKGYKFLGWDVAPENWRVEGDKTFVAQYEKRIPWYKRLWLWLTGLFAGKGCLKWLLWLLLALLLLFLLSLLFRNCTGCSRPIGFPISHSGCSRYPGGGHTGGAIPYPIGDKPWLGDVPDGAGGIYNPGDPYGSVETPGGYNGILPPNMGVLPPLDTNRIVREPGKQAYVDDLLNILMENEDKSIMDLAKDFKAQYQEDKYQIVYYDDVVKRMQVRVPPEERAQLKAEIPGRFAPEYDLYVFDESLFIGGYTPNDPELSDASHAWYLDAIHAKDAWEIAKGNDRLTVAIVDNGFSLKHPEFEGKVVMPYNVWTHDKNVYAQSIDHGTHVAGTTLALMDNGKGLCGIAPNCAFMPVQVADQNGMMTTTSVLDGVLYALYQGADVINLSLGLEFYPGIPENVQQELQDNYFKEEELLWNEVMKISNKHNAIIVIAAGNDNILAGVNPLNRPRNFIVVSAVDKNNAELSKAGFSNYGLYSTVSAPGVGIYSTYGKKGYKSMDGTSMAAPIVTGAVALMKSLKEDITPEQVICVLQGTGEPINGKIGNCLRLDKALKKVQSGDFGDCDSRPETPSTGDVQVLLSWGDYNDLDVACVDPYENVVWFKNKRVPSGGLLEIDMNVNPGDSKTPIENIYWPVGKAPFGTYYVLGWMYKQHETNKSNSPYKLKVVYGGKTEEYEGTLSMADGKAVLCSFTLGDNSTSTSTGSRGSVGTPSNRGNNRVTNPGAGRGNSSNGNSRKTELIQQRDLLQKQLDEINNELKEIGNQ